MQAGFDTLQNPVSSVQTHCSQQNACLHAASPVSSHQITAVVQPASGRKCSDMRSTQPGPDKHQGPAAVTTNAAAWLSAQPVQGCAGPKQKLERAAVCIQRSRAPLPLHSRVKWLHGPKTQDVNPSSQATMMERFIQQKHADNAGSKVSCKAGGRPWRRPCLEAGNQLCPRTTRPAGKPQACHRQHRLNGSTQTGQRNNICRL